MIVLRMGVVLSIRLVRDLRTQPDMPHGLALLDIPEGLTIILSTNANVSVKNHNDFSYVLRLVEKKKIVI